MEFTIINITHRNSALECSIYFNLQQKTSLQHFDINFDTLGGIEISFNKNNFHLYFKDKTINHYVTEIFSVNFFCMFLMSDSLYEQRDL